MTGIQIHASDTVQHKRLGDSRAAAIAARLANGLYLAATPTFAVMALLTGLGDDPMSQVCSSGAGSLLSGMLPMYVLMSMFHSPVWLKLIIGRSAALKRRHT